MNKELREDLEHLIICKDKTITPDLRDDIKMTLDYIDKLEKENETLKQDYINVRNYIKIRKVTTEVEDKALLYNLELENINKKRYEDYKSRICRAIEHIENHQLVYISQYEEMSGFDNHLLDILRGEDNEK